MCRLLTPPGDGEANGIIKAALPRPGSAIIGTTSEQAYDPSPELYDYAQTKIRGPGFWPADVNDKAA
jgi:hypothetical protein